MKNNSYAILNATLLFIVLFTFVSCKDDDLSHPCDSFITPNSAFGIFDKASGHDSIYWLPVGDTIYNFNSGGGNQIHFRAANSSMKSYEWTIGGDPRMFMDSVIFLYFEGTNGKIDINLKVNSREVNGCTDVQLTDSSTQTVYAKVLNSYSEAPFRGRFEGYDEDKPQEKYIIEFAQYGTQLLNFPNGCTNYQGVPIVKNHKYFVFDQKLGYPCGHPTGNGELQPGNKTLIIDYFVEDDNQNLIKKRFVGEKIEE